MSVETSPCHCLICDATLESERELEMNICYACRRYGLLNGHWPDANEITRSLPDAAAGNAIELN